MPVKLHPKPLQLDGIEFLAARKFAYLADEPGGGKTLQVVRAADRFPDDSVLVLVPPAAVETWVSHFRDQAEVERPICIIAESKKVWSELPKELFRPTVFIITHGLPDSQYERIKKLLFTRRFICVIDEAHLVKGITAARSVKLLGWPVYYAQRAWFLSGTPMPNGFPSELWTLLYVCRVTKMSYLDFVERYCISVIRAGKWGESTISGPNPENLAEFRTLIRPFMLRRTAAEIDIKLAKIPLHDQFYEIDPTPLDVETLMHEDVLAHGGRDGLMKMFDMQQILVESFLPRDFSAGGDVQTERDVDRSVITLGAAEPGFATWRKFAGISLARGAARKIVELAQDREGQDFGQHHVVFAFHKDVMDILETELSRTGKVWRVDGSTTLLRRRAAEREFQAYPADKRCYFLGNIVSASVAMTLTSGNCVHVVEQTFTPHHTVQAVRRVHRIGQQRKACFASYFVLKSNAVHRRVIRLLGKKSSSLAAALSLDTADEKIVPFTNPQGLF